MFGVLCQTYSSFEEGSFISTWRTEAEAEAAAAEAALEQPYGEYYVMQLFGEPMEPAFYLGHTNWPEDCPF